MVIGRIHAAGRQGTQFREDEILSIANYYLVAPEKLMRTLLHLETCDHPEILLLQNPACNSKLHAACFVSSVWSRSYRNMSHIWSSNHSKIEATSTYIYRDYYYQCYFTAMELLCSVGCTSLEVENFMSGFLWQLHSLVCVFEAQRNIQALIDPRAKIYLMEGTFEQHIADTVTAYLSIYRPCDHRPIAIGPYVRNGFDMTRIFLPTKYAGIKEYHS